MKSLFHIVLFPSSETRAVSSEWANQRGGEGTICGGPTRRGGLPSMLTTCWKPRGGAQPDSLGSARLPGAAAPTLSLGLSCSGSATRKRNPSQSQHPEQSHLKSTLQLLKPRARSDQMPRHPLLCIFQIEYLNFIFNSHWFCLEEYDKHSAANYLKIHENPVYAKEILTCFHANRRFLEKCVFADALKCVCLVSKPVSLLWCIKSFLPQ